MSISINNIYGNYAANYNATTQKAQTKSAESGKAGTNSEENGITTTIMDLKTSTPGVTRKEAIKTGFSNVNDYSKYLQEKYSYMNTGTISMQGVPTSVNVSSAFLRKCMDDPEKAAWLEENLAAIPKCLESSINYTKGMAGSPVMTHFSVSIDANGNMTMMSGCTNDPDGKIARENAARKAEEAKEAKEKADEKRAEKRAKEKEAAERLAEKLAEKSYEPFTLRFSGRDTDDLMRNMWRSLQSNSDISVSNMNSNFITNLFNMTV